MLWATINSTIESEPPSCCPEPGKNRCIQYQLKSAAVKDLWSGLRIALSEFRVPLELEEGRGEIVWNLPVFVLDHHVHMYIHAYALDKQLGHQKSCGGGMNKTYGDLECRQTSRVGKSK